MYITTTTAPQACYAFQLSLSTPSPHFLRPSRSLTLVSQRRLKLIKGRTCPRPHSTNLPLSLAMWVVAPSAVSKGRVKCGMQLSKTTSGAPSSQLCLALNFCHDHGGMAVTWAVQAQETARASCEVPNKHLCHVFTVEPLWACFLIPEMETMIWKGKVVIPKHASLA